jgi:hypothetical protein
MSKKENKFDPPVGYMVAVQHQMVMITRLATVLEMSSVLLAQKLDESGHKLEPDLFNMVSDCAKVMEIESQKPKPDLQVVPE